MVPFYSVTASADDSSDAVSAARVFNSDFDADKINELYNVFAGQLVRSMVTKDAFVSQLSVMRSTVGGSASARTTIQTQSGTNPSTGQPMFSVRYKVQFPATLQYEDLTLIKEASGMWKLYGFYLNPVPAQ
jgi:hypothetical protein